MGDFHKTTANRFGSTHAHNTSVAKSSIKNHALCTKNRHSMSESEPKTLINFDQVDCCDPLDYFEWENNGAKQKHLNTAMEIAQLDVVAISGDVFGYPGVVPIWLETHPDAVSFRIWSQAPVTPRPLGDDLKWSNDHEIYQAPSPTFDCLHELICKHSVLALPHGTTVSKGINGEHGCVNDSSSEAQPSGIEGVYEEDSTMYFEYESGILRFPGARGLCTAALNVYASNAESPQCGTTYLQRTIEWVHATTMGIESEIAMAGCLVSTTVDFAKATTYKTLKGITVPVDKQQLITALFKTNKTKSSLIALGIFYGLMDLFSDEIQAMPPPPKGDSKPARSRRGSTAATDDDEVESLIADFTPVGDVDRPVQQEDIEPNSPLPGTIEGERKKNEELEARLRSLESKLTQPPSSEGSVTTEIQRQIQLALEVQAKTLRYEADEQMRRHNEQLENKMKSMEAQKEAEILVAVQDAKDAFNVIAENQASKAEELENEIRRLQDFSDKPRESTPRDKFDEMKTLMVRTEAKYCFNSEKGYNAYIFYSVLKRQLHLISQYKGGMTLKRYMEIIARMTDDDTTEGMPEQAESDPQLKALYASTMKYAERKSPAMTSSPTKSVTVTSEGEPGTYTNKLISKNIVVVPEDSPYHPSQWDYDTHHLDGKLYTMVEQYWFAGPMLKKMTRECTSVAYGQTYSYAVTIAIKDMLTRELTRKRMAGRMWTEPSLALTFTNPEEFLHVL